MRWKNVKTVLVVGGGITGLSTMYYLQKENRERNLQHAIIDIKKKYGKNAILKGMNFENGGTTIQRNSQIGGHRSG